MCIHCVPSPSHYKWSAQYWEMMTICLCRKHLSGICCGVTYVDLEAYMRLLENWYDIQCFPYHSNIHYNQYVLFTCWKVLKIGQLCHFMQVCVCVWATSWFVNCCLEISFNIFPHVFYKFSLQSWVKTCAVLTNILYLSKCNTGFFLKSQCLVFGDILILRMGHQTGLCWAKPRPALPREQGIL
jgi:hypothetical protein